MATVLSFVCESSRKGWTAKCCNRDDVEEFSADDRWELEKKLKEVSCLSVGCLVLSDPQEALSKASGGVSSAFSWVTPKTAIYQFTIGGAAMVMAAGMTQNMPETRTAVVC